jgi:5-methyltetrahydrofolate--homocysteine methyltransferase
VVVGCIDEDKQQGMAVTRVRKLAVAERSHALLTEKYGVPARDLIFDALVFPVGTGDVNYIGSAVETIEGIRAIKARFPESKTILGISNVSFGLPPAGREVLNAVFLYHCTKAGLDYAIVNTERLERYPSIPEEERRLAEDLIYWRGDDPVAAFAAHFRGRKKEAKTGATLPLDERLARYIVEGSKDGLLDDLALKRKEAGALEIINGPLMKGMEEVGRLFNDNQLIVAEVLQSAEAMKAAVAYLEPFMEKDESATRATLILATVKGDVHDIGKNLVEIVLKNNGYRIINLGIKVPPEDLIAAYHQHKPDAFGLSGLLVKSAQQMVTTAQDLRAAGIEIPLFVGGAALTRKFTATRISVEYGGPTLYAKDAMDGLDLANRLFGATTREALIERLRAEQERLRAGAEVLEAPLPAAAAPARSAVSRDVSLPPPPDLDLHVLRRVPLTHIYPYLNLQMLLGKHLGVKGSVRRLLAEGDAKTLEINAAIEELKREAVEQGWLEANALYRFFEARSVGNDLILSRDGREAARFTFPRQRAGERLCLADYVRDAASAEPDHVALFAVTCGKGVRDLAEGWKEEGRYLRSHAIQALAIELAEALAEMLHTRLRTQWGFSDPPGLSMEDRLKARYRGIRVSFGYPACPNLADQRILFDLLEPSQIGLGLTEGFMMDPEASVSALVFHHPEAKYFKAE